MSKSYNIIVPIEYDSVWKFWDKSFNNIVLENDGEKFKVSFNNPTEVKPYDRIPRAPHRQFRERSPWEDEPGWGSYEEYGGPNGYDDFTIDAAFEGDPDAVWNID